MTTKEDISDWFDRGIKSDATHMLVACDTFSHEDYPVFVERGEDPHEKVAEYQGQNMQRVMEVYNLAMDKKRQLAERFCFNY